MRRESPLIFVGMHRSGTTLISHFLDDIGFHMGTKKCKMNNESVFFQRMNKWILWLHNAEWDSPENLDYSNEFLRDHILRFIRETDRRSFDD